MTRHTSATPDGSKAVVEALKEHGQRYYQPDRERLPKHVGDLVYTNPFAFLVGAAFDRGLPWKSAWEIPYRIDQRGMLDPFKLASSSEARLKRLLESLPVRPRYGGGARTLKEAAALVVKHGGNAAAIWEGVSPTQASRRLRSIHGVGPGIASMAVRLLHDDWGMFKGQEREIDVKPDVHVMRVFKRAGLASSESEGAAVEAAQRLNPDYPAQLDWPAWNIGQEWCRPTAPDCPGCPLTNLCPKLTG